MDAVVCTCVPCISPCHCRREATWQGNDKIYQQQAIATKHKKEPAMTASIKARARHTGQTIMQRNCHKSRQTHSRASNQPANPAILPAGPTPSQSVTYLATGGVYKTITSCSEQTSSSYALDNVQALCSGIQHFLVHMLCAQSKCAPAVQMLADHKLLGGDVLKLRLRQHAQVNSTLMAQFAVATGCPSRSVLDIPSEPLTQAMSHMSAAGLSGAQCKHQVLSLICILVTECLLAAADTVIPAKCFAACIHEQLYCLWLQ